MPARPFRPSIEPLGCRLLPSITLSNGVLRVDGTPGDDTIVVEWAGSDRTQVTLNGDVRTFSPIRVAELEVRARGGNDTVRIDSIFVRDKTLVNGGPGDDMLSCGVAWATVNGGDGNDSCTVSSLSTANGGAGDDILSGYGSESEPWYDPVLDGGPGNDLCYGNAYVTDGLAAEADLIGTLAGGGTGSASFGYRYLSWENGRRFHVQVAGLVADGTAQVYLAGVPVGGMQVVGGAGTFDRMFGLWTGQYLTAYPTRVPEVHAGSVVEVKLGGQTVLAGTLGDKENLLVNAGFEVGYLNDPRYGWVSGGNTAFGADLYLNDSVADAPGLRAGFLGHFVGVRSLDESSWLAAQDFGTGTRQGVAQQLRRTLDPGVSYTLSAAVRQSLDLAPGGYEVFLSPSSAFYDPGAVRVGALAPTDGEDAWLFREITFTTPANARALPFLVLVPLSATPGTHSDIGLDLTVLYRTP